MAFAAAGNSGWFALYTIMDRNEDTTVLTRELDAADFATASGHALEHLGDLQLVSDAVCISYMVGLRLNEQSIVIPSVGELQTRARLSIRLANGQGKATHDIFAPKETIFRALTGKDNKIVDITNTNVLDYVENFKASSLAPIFISDGERADEMSPIVQGRKASARS